MRRRIGVVVAVLALVGVASGCSLREVQLWFAFNKQQNISREQAKNIADVINSRKAAGGCDTNYAGGCVPDNATSVHCVGSAGSGPEVRGPLTVKGWDSFELDPDGDKNVCVDPGGAIDVIGQELGGVVIRGWAFDPNSTGPINVDVYDNDIGARLDAADPRPDLEAAYPNVGANHGFDLASGAEAGQTRKICIVGINVGVGNNTLLRCKTVTVLDIAAATVGTGEVLGLVEQADRRADGGVHVRGFVYADGTFPLSVTPYLKGNTSSLLDSELTANHQVDRPDAASAIGAITSMIGFDVVIPASQLGTNPSTQICLEYRVTESNTPVGSANLQCRDIDS